MLKESDPLQQARRRKRPASGWLRLPAHLLDEMVGFATLGACLGGVAGSFTETPAIFMVFGAQFGALWTIVLHMIRGEG